jgi:pimeloyl-ACP methyl ester carboxylesterase
MRSILLFCAMAPFLLVSGVHAEEAAGDWGGLLAGSLRVVVHIKKSGAEGYTAVLESPDQGDAMIPVDTVKAGPDGLSFTVSRVKGSYVGHWDASKRAWEGIWDQGRPMPLEFKRVDAAGVKAMAPKRPQEEAIERSAKSFASRSVSFENAKGTARLAGTLSLPEGKGPFPAVLLVAGSGPQTRDEAVAGHRIFMVLADALNRRGLAVLRYDKRGVGASKGDYAAATSADFEDDAQAAVEFLKSDGEVDPRHLGIIGHSEGGTIAPAVAVRDPAVSFIVLLAGPGLRGDKLLTEQQALIAAADGMPADKVARLRDFVGRSLAALAKAPDREQAEDIARRAAARGKALGIPGIENVEALVKMVTEPWFLYFLKDDPAPVLRKVRVPVLALGGSLDLQVAPDSNLAAIREALKGNPGATVRELPGLNHLFQKAHTGSPLEYGTIAETMDPSALGAIGDWILGQVRSPAR